MRKITMCSLAGAACALLLALPAVAANNTTAGNGSAADRTAWPAETMTGKITMVDPGQNLLVVTYQGVPFDMVVTPNTRIRSGDQALTLKDLQQDQNKGVSLRFVPESRGDVAQTIRISG